MRLTIYDKNPGKGLNQWFLMASWAVGCFLQKLFGKVDDYYAAKSWEDAYAWLSNRPGTITSLQYWGHGSPGLVWLAGRPMDLNKFIMAMKSKVTPQTIIWWRTCSTFHGEVGYYFSQRLADGLECTIAGHTRIIGPIQGGLHTRKPHSLPMWPKDEGELPPSKLPSWLQWGPNSVLCFATKVPEGW